MKRLIDNLQSFNSKERFFLIGHILGNTNFTPSEVFKKQIKDVLGLKIPDELFAAMDYHLDWLYGSLYLAFNNGSEAQIFSNSDRLIKGQQEDVDFIIAFLEDTSCHIILIEAKGVGGWTNKQMNSKAERFEGIFGPDGKRWLGVNPHFLVLSPRQSNRLNTSSWPTWMTINGKAAWTKLPVSAGLRKITLCSSTGIPDKNGSSWMVSIR